MLIEKCVKVSTMQINVLNSKFQTDKSTQVKFNDIFKDEIIESLFLIFCFSNLIYLFCHKTLNTDEK